MDISVIICSYNSAGSLRRTLDTCCALIIPECLAWELLVVDNNSNDNTKQVCAEFTDRLPLRYLFEPRLGKSCALNLALQEGNGDLFLFTDADIDVDVCWLEGVALAARAHPEVSFFGGRVCPRWESPPPRWIQENDHPLLASLFPRYELGPAGPFLAKTDHLFLGANLAIRSSVFRLGLRFNELLGPQGAEQVHGEETDLQLRLLEEGHCALFIPDALVHHRNPPERMTERYVRRYCRGIGVRDVRLRASRRQGRKCCGAPIGLWTTLFKQALKYSATRLCSQPAAWLEAEVRMAVTWGRICEIRRLHTASGFAQVSDRGYPS